MWFKYRSIKSTPFISENTLYPSYNIICYSYTPFVDLSRAIYIKLHSYWNLWLLDRAVLIVGLIEVLPYLGQHSPNLLVYEGSELL
jgi:hypothetical protein